nr:MAG TPA: leucine rich repeat protein [Caudoviricetes sp.]
MRDTTVCRRSQSTQSPLLALTTRREVRPSPSAKPLLGTERKAEMAANKVIVNNQTILDLTADTVTAATLKKGVTAHDASGTQITGTLEESSTSETWVLNDGQIDNIPPFSGSVKFTSFGTDFFGISAGGGSISYWNDVDGAEMTIVVEEGAWVSPQYRKLVFDTPPTGDLLTWLTANGVKQPANLAVQPSKDVTITSNGTTEITPDAPYDVMEKANLTVNVESGSTSASPKDINFYDYDGTLVAAWELSELAGKTALPDYPTHDGLTCQGWNWTLADLKAENAKMNVGAMYITSDGKTRIYITLQEGRKSPMLGVCPNGTITVDWGDGTTPNTLTGTSVTTVKWTPTHNYAAPGDYVITLTVNGTFGIVGEYAGGKLLCYSSNASDNRNRAYRNAIHRVFLGDGVTSIGNAAFTNCYSLAQITLPSGVTSISGYAFASCYGMAFYDFTVCTAVPTLDNANAFNSNPSDFEIRVPAALLNEWKAATNWATYASHIVGV